MVKPLSISGVFFLLAVICCCCFPLSRALVVLKEAGSGWWIPASREKLREILSSL
jgi:hypothetical protein